MGAKTLSRQCERGCGAGSGCRMVESKGTGAAANLSWIAPKKAAGEGTASKITVPC
jgi:hypothetical protein